MKKFVKVTHLHFTDQKSFFEKMEELSTPKSPLEGGVEGVPSSYEPMNTPLPPSRGDFDFLDGVVFSPAEFVISVGTFTDEAPFISDYTGTKIYYQSIRTKGEDFLTTKDYIWRWDTDWFWCSSHFGVQNPLLRRLIPKKYLRSDSYWKVRSFFQRTAWAGKVLDAVKGKSEAVVQDVEIPIEHAPEFLEFFQKEIRIKPIWICPVKALDPTITYDLYPLEPNKVYLNFGFWDAVPTTHEEGYYNRLIEKKVMELKGKKSLYSSSYYPKEEFWSLYNKEGYETLKKKYDPSKRFKDLYEKCVGRG